jgi:hypothetical protein
MKRVVTATALAEWIDADCNEIQDRAVGMVSANNSNDLSTPKGMNCLVWQASTVFVAGATQRLIDDSNDWRDYFVEGICYPNTTAAVERIGDTNDYNLEALAASDPPVYFSGYLGTGAYSNITTGAAVAAAAEPVRGAGAFRSYFVNLRSTTSQLTLFCDPANGKLYIYCKTLPGKPTILMRGYKAGKR